MKNSLKIKLITILLVPITIILNIISKRYPEFVERYYSDFLNKPVRQVLSLIAKPFPFSISEFLIFILLAGLITFFILALIKIRKVLFLNNVLNLLVYASVLYILFMFLWGFNYNRLSFDKIAGLKIEKSSKKELYELCESLIVRANKLRAEVDQNSKGVMVIPGGYKDVFSRAEKGYVSASKLYPELSGKYGPPKRILLSERLSYTGITGIYIPYTGEPNVNINVTDFMLPCTAAHEMAHQRGFAREDEANYIAYLACSMHPDKDFQYSGVMLGLIYSMNALADADVDSYRNLAKTYSSGVKADLVNDIEVWQKYKGKIEKISNNVNNTYLKSNGQQDGVESYGRMVDLLLAEHKGGKK